MKLPKQLYLSKQDSDWLISAEAKPGKPIYARGHDPNEAVNILAYLFGNIKCETCIDTGYYYDHIKLKSVKCNHDH